MLVSFWVGEVRLVPVDDIVSMSYASVEPLSFAEFPNVALEQPDRCEDHAARQTELDNAKRKKLLGLGHHQHRDRPMVCSEHRYARKPKHTIEAGRRPRRWSACQEGGGRGEGRGIFLKEGVCPVLGRQCFFFPHHIVMFPCEGHVFWGSCSCLCR